MLSSALKNLASVDAYIVWIFLGILFAGLLAYLAWARPKLVGAQAALERLAAAIEHAPDVETAKAQADAAVATNSGLKDAWSASQSRVIKVGPAEQPKALLLNSVEDLWRPDRLLHKQFNFAMFEAIPNIAVGVGLFFTFVFLTLALTDASSALAKPGQTVDVVKATRELLGSAGGKFLSSLAGLLVSLVWTIVGRRRVARLDRASVRVVAAIEALWPPLGAEAVVMDQLAQLKQVADKLVALQAVQVQAKQVQEDQVGLAEELLLESKEQTGSLKRFETDLAISIGNAITNSFGPQMEQMTGRLERAISNLSDRVGSMNEDALRKMMEDFSSSLRSNTGKEIDSFKATLSSLAEALDKSAGGLQTGVEQAAATLAGTTSELDTRLGEASTRLVGSVDAIKELLDHTRNAVQDVDMAVSRAAELGGRGVESLTHALENADHVVARVSDSAQRWQAVTEKMEGVTGSLAEVADGVDEITQEQKAVVRSVREAGPEVVHAVSRMKDILESSTGQVAESMGMVQSAMDRTSRDLTGVVTSITTGVGEYTQQVAELHRAMDNEMAKAVGKLGGVIQNLDDSVGELTDALGDLDSKK
ncbi:hypothetical protein [Ideonella margarita]|uniref:Methyl-accepting chemotaxis protein n=1 Tax=Ideonella margarita TaxID=2984191 RepID=A0ABU9CC12_9BURK